MAEEPLARDRIIREVLWHVDAAAEKLSWGQSPELSIVFRTTGVWEGLYAEAFDLQPFPGFLRVCAMAGGQVSRAIEIMAGATPEQPAELINGVFGGAMALVLIAEYQTTVPPADAPEGDEIRMVTAVMTDGSYATLYHPRDGVPQLMGCSSDENARATGRLIEAMQALAKVTISAAAEPDV